MTHVVAVLRVGPRVLASVEESVVSSGATHLSRVPLDLQRVQMAASWGLWKDLWVFVATSDSLVKLPPNI